MKKRFKKLWETKRGLVVIAGLLVLVSPCLCLGGLVTLGNTAPVPTATKLPAIQPPSQPTPTVYHTPAVSTPMPTNIPKPASYLSKLGNILEQQGYSLCALAVEDPATKFSILYEPEVGKKLVAVEIVVGNVSGEQFTSNPLRATMVDTEGFMYGVETGSAGGQIELLEINPGEKVRGWIGFVVPEGTVPMSLKYDFDYRVTLQVGLKGEGQE